MISLITIRLAIAALGVAAWLYGVASDQANVRLLGMILLAAALLLRFAHRR